MKKELGLGVSVEIKQTKTLGKIAIIDNHIGSFNNCQLIRC